MRIISDVLKKNRAAIILIAVISAANCTVFVLYDMLTEPLLYSMAISFFCMAAVIAAEFFREKKRAEEREYIISGITENHFELPVPDTAAEEDYQKMISLLGAEKQRLENEYGARVQDAEDYYSAWVHQIKTPIAVMKLKLSEETPENRALRSELFRIEQYVDMVLQYIRLGSDTNDLVISEYSADEMIRESIRKYAPQFIEKKLQLEYEPTDACLVTDRKWFVCILDQLISNAVKYTRNGGVSVSVKGKTVVISDTGIGIAKEDLPRIFEKGYTGNNGRAGEKSSGLGLYLAKRAANLLNVRISAESEAGKGSVFRIDIQN